MRVKDDELYDFIRDFGRRNGNTTKERLLAVLKGKFYGREDARQLLYRLEHLNMIQTNDQQIRIRLI